MHATGRCLRAQSLRWATWGLEIPEHARSRDSFDRAIVLSDPAGPPRRECTVGTAWDAFISYARADSEATAIAVQRGLERFARPWNQRRAVRIFRDDAAMSTNPALWSSIEAGLTAAGHLVVLLSPAAAISAYVDKEIRWWLEHKGPATVLLVLDAGELDWDDAGNRFTADSAVPPCLSDAFAEEPRWLDLRWTHASPSPAADPRFAAAMADLSAPIRGVARDELIGEDLTQHRRVRRLTRSAVSLLVLLLVVSVVSTVLAIRQRDDVLRQAVTLRSRQLASTATGLLDSDLRLGQLLAVQGFRTERSEATEQALRQAAFASPLIERFTTFDADIAGLARSSDGSTVAVALVDGRVYTVATQARAAPVLRFTTPAPANALRLSADGNVLLASTRDGVTVADGAGTRHLPGDPPAPLDAIALSASGSRVALVTGTTTGRIVVVDTGTGQTISRRRDPLGVPPGTPVLYPQYTARLGFVDDRTLRLLGVDARWADLDLRTGRTSRAGSTTWAPYANLFVPSPDADYLLSAPISNGRGVQLWRTGRAGRDRPPQRADVTLTDPLDLAVSPDGRLVLVNDASTGLSVAPVSRPDQAPVVPATRVPGVSGITAIEFVGPTTAVVAARTELVFLRFGGVGRSATATPLVPRGVGGVPEYAADFRDSRLSVSPDGSRVAVFQLNSAELEIVPLPGRQAAAQPRVALGASDLLDALFGAVWLDNDTALVLSAEPGGVVKGLPPGVARWNLGLRLLDSEGDREVPIGAMPTPAGTVLVATSGGTIQTRSGTGRLVGEVDADTSGTRFDLAGFTRDGRSLALVSSGSTGLAGAGETTGPPVLTVVDVATGSTLHTQRWPDGSVVAGLAVAGTTVLVSHPDGTVDVLADLGRGPSALVTTAGSRTSTGSAQENPPVVGANGLVGFPTRSGLQLYDLATLQPSGTLPVPPGLEAVPRTYAFAPDGHTLVTGYFGGDPRTAQVSARDLGTPAIVASLCATAGSPITPDDWRRVVGDTPPDDPGCR